MRGDSVYLSAICDLDGEVDSSYLAMFWLTTVSCVATVLMIVGEIIAMWCHPEHRFDAVALGQGIGLVWSGYGVALGAAGAFRRLDRPHP